MKITVFGSTGKTGIHLVTQAVERGHEVTALVRDPARLQVRLASLKVQRARLEVVPGDILNPQAVEKAIAGAEAVVSVLGPSSNEPIFAISKGMKHILAAMEKHGVRRLIQSVGAGVPDPNDQPRLLNKVISFLVRTLSRYVYEDMKRVSDLIRECDRDWTLVRVPMLVEGEQTGQIRTGYVGVGVGSRLLRGDLAAFMLDQLEADDFLQKAPAISN